jgi:hypothetical protein
MEGGMFLKKLALNIILLCMFENYIHADILDKLYAYTSRDSLKVYNFDRYFCCLYTAADNCLFVDNGDDTIGNCIAAYKIDKHKIRLIIKHYSYGYDEINDEIYEHEIKYFNVEITELDNGIQCTWEEISPVNLDGFIFNEARIMYDETVDVRLEPSFNSEIYARIGCNDYEKVKVLTIGDERKIIGRSSDFWYKIEYDHKEFWAYGYALYFSESIELK